ATAAGAGTATKIATRTVPKKAAPARRPVRRRPKRQVHLPDSGRRLRLTTVLILVLFLAISGRLVELQLTDAKSYARTGLEKRTQPIPLAAPRGTIYDRDRNVLAHSVQARYVYGDPGLVADPEGEARQLAPLLGVPASELVPKLGRHNYKDGTLVRFEYLARGVDVPVADKIKALNLPGIGIDADERRDEPGHDLASNPIAFAAHQLKSATGPRYSANDR